MLMSTLKEILISKPGKLVHTLFHVIMLILSIFLIISISIDTFRGSELYNAPRFVREQTAICAFFMLDFFVELIYAERKWKFLATHFIFFLVSIPYLYIFYHFGVEFAPQSAYLIQYIPLVRGGYALAIVVGWFTYNRITGIFVTYMVTLVATIYFGSLAFFMFEHSVNPDVTGYSDALFWACMDTTTVGSDIYAITPVGRVASVVLAALGMMMFPIFTVYITSLITRRRKAHKEIIPAEIIPPSMRTANGSKS